MFAALLGLAFSPLLARLTPMRLMPVASWSTSFCSGLEYVDSGVLIIVIYLHLVGFGAILLSGFRSAANEMFDPRRAKVQFGRIASAGTVGGICGGLLAERGAALFGTVSLLLLLALLHFSASLVLWRTAANNRQPAINAADLDNWQTAREAFGMRLFW